MIKSKRLSAILLAAMLVVSTFSGCGAASKPAESSAPAAGAATSTAAPESTAAGSPVNIRMAGWSLATSPEYAKTIAAFEAENPNIKVEAIDISAQEYKDKMTVMLSSGDDVDAICIYDLFELESYRSRNQIMPLDDYIAKAAIDLAPYGGSKEDCTLEGKMYALPYRSDIYVTYFNKDIFDAAGVPYPTNDMTWAQYRETAKKLTKGEGADKVFGAYIHNWGSCVQMWGTLGSDLNRTSGDYKIFKPYYEMALGMQNDDKSIMDFATIKTSSAHYSSQFETGKTAMVVMGSWFIGRLVSDKAKGEYNGNWGMVSAPHSDTYSAGTTVSGTTPIAINSKSKNPDAAWEFVKYLTTEPGAKIFASNGVLPGYRSDAVMDAYVNQPGMPEGSKEALTTVSTKNDFPTVKNASEIDTILEEEHELVMLGEKTIDQGIADMESRVKAAKGE